MFPPAASWLKDCMKLNRSIATLFRIGRIISMATKVPRPKRNPSSRRARLVVRISVHKRIVSSTGQHHRALTALQSLPGAKLAAFLVHQLGCRDPSQRWQHDGVRDSSINEGVQCVPMQRGGGREGGP